MKNVTAVLVLVLVLGSSAMFAACATTPSAPPTEGVQTTAAKKAGADQVQHDLDQAVATLKAQANKTELAFKSAEESTIATRVAATISAAQSTATETRVPPTETEVAPSATPTWTPVPPTPTSAAPTSTPTITLLPRVPVVRTNPAHAFKYPAPFLGRPAKWKVIVGQNTDLTFAWRSSVLLAPDERFIIYTRSTFDYNGGGWSSWCPTGWTQDTEWTSTGDWRATSPGCFGEMMKGVQKVIQWQVAIHRFVDDQILEALSPASEPSEFIWRASF